MDKASGHDEKCSHDISCYISDKHDKEYFL